MYVCVSSKNPFGVEKPWISTEMEIFVEHWFLHEKTRKNEFTEKTGTDK